MAGKSDGSNSSLRGAIATKQSTLVLRRDGLLRFARNDGENFFSVRHSGARRRREPGIHNHHQEYGFRARAKAARPGMTVVGMLVIARSDSDEAIHTCLAAIWIASLALAMTGKITVRHSGATGPREARPDDRLRTNPESIATIGSM